VVIAVVGAAPQLHGSRGAMLHCAATSPLTPVGSRRCRAIARRRAGERRSGGAQRGRRGQRMAMHAAAIASRPAILYWQPATLAALAAVRGCAVGAPAWATIDAGPRQVLADLDHADAIAPRCAWSRA
jgi:diphosphomevalonate decarboxylase